MTTPTSHSQQLPLTSLEAIWLLRWLRHSKDEMNANLLLIEERLKTIGHDGQLESGHHAIDADVMIADGIIRKLWTIIGPSAGGPPP